MKSLSARFHIMDCHDFLRSLAMTEWLACCHCEKTAGVRGNL
ncbi:hypothetical protein [Helicobacter sp.]|nr:hypothetical protein [Helicobacter sp.]MDY5556696.1 hypothetical protein [Helicobacter sp.]